MSQYQCPPQIVDSPRKPTLGDSDFFCFGVSTLSAPLVDPSDFRVFWAGFFRGLFIPPEKGIHLEH